MTLAMTRGIDVSACQGRVDWSAVAALGCRFAWVKSSEGNRGRDPIFDLPGYLVDHARALGVSGRDPRFAENVAGARAAGLRVGPYHFAYPLPHDGVNANRDPADQAKFAFDLAGGLGSLDGELPPLFDFEWPPPPDWSKWGCSDKQLRTWGLDCLGNMEALWGCLPVVYTYKDFWLRVGGPSEPAFARYPLNFASYPTPAAWPAPSALPPPLAPWARATFWQHTGGGLVLPVTGAAADFDVFLGDEAALEELCRGSVAAGA